MGQTLSGQTLKETKSFLACPLPEAASCEELHVSILSQSLRISFNGFLSRLLLLEKGVVVVMKSLCLNSESVVISTTAEVASLTFTICGRSMHMDLHMVSGDSSGPHTSTWSPGISPCHRPQHGLQGQYKPWTSTNPFCLCMGHGHHHSIGQRHLRGLRCQNRLLT